MRQLVLALNAFAGRKNVYPAAGTFFEDPCNFAATNPQASSVLALSQGTGLTGPPSAAVQRPGTAGSS